MDSSAPPSGGAGNYGPIDAAAGNGEKSSKITASASGAYDDPVVLRGEDKDEPPSERPVLFKQDTVYDTYEDVARNFKRLASGDTAADNEDSDGFPASPRKTKSEGGAAAGGTWNGEFQSALSALQEAVEDGSSDMELAAFERLSQLAADFRQMAVTYGRIIITERGMPDEQKTIKSAKLSGFAGGSKFFVSTGSARRSLGRILFKWPDDKHNLYGSNLANAAKINGHEVQACATVFAACPEMRVPLVTVVDYRGFRLTAMAVLPVGADTLAIGSMDGGSTFAGGEDDPDMVARASAMADRLNLRPHDVVAQGGARTTVYGPWDLEHHRGTDGYPYLLDFSRLMPPEHPREAAAASGRSDAAAADPPGSTLFRLLRPELVASNPVPLSSDAFSSVSARDGLEGAQADVAAATRRLFADVIPSFVRWLRAQKTHDPRAYPSSVSLTSLLHQRGINVRHLGRVYDALEPHEPWAHVALVEMSARCVKTELRQALREAATSGDSSSRPADVIVSGLNRYLRRLTRFGGTLESWAQRNSHNQIESVLMEAWQQLTDAIRLKFGLAAAAFLVFPSPLTRDTPLAPAGAPAPRIAPSAAAGAGAAGLSEYERARARRAAQCLRANGRVLYKAVNRRMLYERLVQMLGLVLLPEVHAARSAPVELVALSVRPALEDPALLSMRAALGIGSTARVSEGPLGGRTPIRVHNGRSVPPLPPAELGDDEAGVGAASRRFGPFHYPLDPTDLVEDRPVVKDLRIIDYVTGRALLLRAGGESNQTRAVALLGGAVQHLEAAASAGEKSDNSEYLARARADLATRCLVATLRGSAAHRGAGVACSQPCPRCLLASVREYAASSALADRLPMRLMMAEAELCSALSAPTRWRQRLCLGRLYPVVLTVGHMRRGAAALPVGLYTGTQMLGCVAAFQLRLTGGGPPVGHLPDVGGGRDGDGDEPAAVDGSVNGNRSRTVWIDAKHEWTEPRFPDWTRSMVALPPAKGGLLSSAKHPRLAAGGDVLSHQVSIMNVRNGRELSSCDPLEDARSGRLQRVTKILALAAYRVGSTTLMATGGFNGSVVVYDVSSESRCSMVHLFEGHLSAVEGLAAVEVGGATLLLSCGHDVTVRVWDASLPSRGGGGGPLPRTAAARAAAVPAGAEPHERCLHVVAAAEVDGGVRASGERYVTVGEELATPGAHEHWVLAVDAVPADRDGGAVTVVTGSFDHTLRVWRLERDGDGEVKFTLLRVMRGHTEGVWSLRTLVWPVACAGQLSGVQLCVSGACDGSVRVWLLSTGSCVKVLTAHSGDVYGVDAVVAPVPWGKRGEHAVVVASSSSDETVAVWAFQMPASLRADPAALGALVAKAGPSRLGGRPISGEYGQRPILGAAAGLRSRRGRGGTGAGAGGGGGAGLETVPAPPRLVRPDSEEAAAAALAAAERKDEERERAAAAAPPPDASNPPPPAPAPPAEEVREVVEVRKGLAAVDPDCPVADSTHVYTEGREPWLCTLNQTNIGDNNNKFYVLQLLESDNGSEYMVFTKWGRVGGKKAQQRLMRAGADLAAAKKEYNKKFRDKTKNEWAERASFVHHKGKYMLLHRAYGDGDGTGSAGENDLSAGPPSRLEPRVAGLVHLIADHKMMEREVAALGYNAAKLPLGRLAAQTLEAGYDVLRQIADVLAGDGGLAGPALAERLRDLSSQFYTLIPHSFGMRKPPVLATMRQVREKLDMLKELGEVRVAKELIARQDGVAGESPLDGVYRRLRCDIRALDPGDEAHAMVRQYVASGHSPAHQSFRLEVEEVFDVSREGADERCRPLAERLGNRTLLWHGSRLSNYLGILSQGLRIAPPEAPVTGYMFDKGIYCADLVSKSAQYCRATGDGYTGLLLLCDVALGESKELLAADYNARETMLRAGRTSVKGVGKMQPDPSAAVSTPDGATAFVGRPVPNPAGEGSTLLHNEFIVYDVAQVRQRYLVRVRFRAAAAAAAGSAAAAPTS